MAIIKQENILKVLAGFNPWWKTGAVAPAFLKSYKRISYYETLEKISHTTIRRNVILYGARRVGKTTIIYQVIDNLLKQGVAPEQIVFISLDHPILKLSSMDAILECYHENIHPDKDVYYFFDEIQYAADWPGWLKIIYDTQPKSKVIATGSASPALVKGSTESGAGRWSVIQVPTLSFYEYCSLIGISITNLPKNLLLSQLLSITQAERTNIMLKLESLRLHFNRYLLVGGFPELALAEDDFFAQQIMREDIVDKVLKRDLPALYNIRNPLELERIFLYLCNVSSEIVSYDSIAKELNGVSRPTVENYVRYLESANLIYISNPVHIEGKKILKSKPKIYIADAAIRNAVLMNDDLLTNAAEMGKIVETTIYKHVKTFCYRKATSVGYYRAAGSEKEIDVVAEYPANKDILIEVKYREQAPISNNDAICTLAGKAELGIIITKRQDDYGVHDTPDGKQLLRIPAYAFCYLLSLAEKNNIASF